MENNLIVQKEDKYFLSLKEGEEPECYTVKDNIKVMKQRERRHRKKAQGWHLVLEIKVMYLLLLITIGFIAFVSTKITINLICFIITINSCRNWNRFSYRLRIF